MAIISELFIKLGLSSAALDKGLEQTKLKVKQTAREVRKETGEARDATALLGRMFGVQLPAQVQKFAASVAPVRQLLAGAFRASIVAGFTVAIGAAVVKAVEWFNVWRTGSDVFGAIEKRLAGMTTAFEKLGDAQLQSARDANRLAIALKAAELAGLGGAVPTPTALALLRGGPSAGARPALAPGPSIAENEAAKRLGVELAKLRDTEDAITAIVGARNEERERELRKVKKIKKETFELVNALHGLEQTGRPSLLRPGERIFPFLQELTEVPLSTKLQDWTVRAGELRLSLRTLGEVAIDQAGELRRFFGPEGITPDPELLNRGLQRIKESLTGVSDRTAGMRRNFEQAFQAIGQDLENAIVHFKGFGNVMLSVLQEIQRALVRTFLISPFVGFLTKGLSALIGGGLARTINVGGFSFPPVPTPPIPRQHGGSVLAGRAYLVGERGPEPFIPAVNGTVLPNRALRDGGAGAPVVNIDNRGADLLAIARMVALIQGQAFGEFARRQADFALRTV